MKIFLLMLCVCISVLSKAQEFNDWGVNKLILNIPDSQANSTVGIASYVKSNFDNETKKVRAIYTWVTTNIRYDKDSANQINLGVNPDAKITVALKRRRGVCENYSAIFNDICLKSGLTSFVINGYTKQQGIVDKTGHTWCAVSANGNWALYDPTWDEHCGMYPKYFMVRPEEFIQSHMPYDPLWQLLNYPISHQQFYSGNIWTNKKSPFYNYRDSITVYMQMDSLQKLKSAVARIQKDEISNSLVKNNSNFIKMNIEIINQDKDVELYNSSVDDLNEATSIYNSFIEYRNKKFTPEKTDAELQALLDGIEKKLLSALGKLGQIDKSEATFTIGTDHVRNKVNTMMDLIKEQKDFVKRYTSTEKSSRESLFYK